MTKINWKKFDKEILKPFEKKGDEAGMYMGTANVFSYTQVRLIARKAFKAAIASQQAEEGRKLK
ncbi:unnamed protein product [marine sediment metagenome]|uniref:Uncharacterized protein n=1 Tax=marine sediment metagenome TaxID=412755 RepID=X1CG11_9ZZZZ